MKIYSLIVYNPKHGHGYLRIIGSGFSSEEEAVSWFKNHTEVVETHAYVNEGEVDHPEIAPVEVWRGER